tara:strand:- start:1245 stop:1439 length:195 start_codon:yes stop_codon:yes gene_type:complete
MKLNIETEKVETVYKFKEALKRQPEFFLMNQKQNIMISASPQDGVYIDLRDPNNVIEFDLDDTF